MSLKTTIITVTQFLINAVATIVGLTLLVLFWAWICGLSNWWIN